MGNNVEKAINSAKKKIDKITPDVDDVKEAFSKAGDKIENLFDDAKEKVHDTKETIADKVNELDNELKDAINDYNKEFTRLNDSGLKLYMDRVRAVDLIENVETIINSIANHPKEFDTDLGDIAVQKKTFKGTCDFAKKELEAAQHSAGGAGAGMAAGAGVASLAPSAAMWVATTFGTASTGTAISTLSGAAAQSAALAWLGGGALVAEGGGMAAGNALLALAGPIGWGIAGASILTSVILFARKRGKINKEKNNEITAVKKNTKSVKETNAQVVDLINKTKELRDKLTQLYEECLPLYSCDYVSQSEEDKLKLGGLVNNTKALAKLLGESVK